MAKYRVVLGEVATYMAIVEADNETEAGEKAEQLMQDEGVIAFQCEVNTREVESVDLAD